MNDCYPLAQVVALMAFAWVAGLILGVLIPVAWRLGHRVGARGP